MSSRRGTKKRSVLGTIGLVIALAAIWYWQERGGGGVSDAGPTGDTTVRETAAPKAPVRPEARSDDHDEDVVLAAFRDERSDVWVTLEGVVSKTLPDDNDGSRHQRFILRLSSGHTVLVAHNIDLAPRAPLDRDDRVRLHGEYEWTEQGGVVHWTHHDPGGRHAGGWIEVGGKRYE